MKIALCIDAFTPYTNGVITHVAMLRQELEKRGHSCLIVTADPTIKHHTVIDGILRCPAKKMKNIYGYGLALISTKSRMKALADFNPDIIHIHTELSMGFFAIKFSKKYNIPVCYTLHTMYEDYAHYLFKTKLQRFFARPIAHYYFSHFTKNADVMISPSEKANVFLEQMHIRGRDVVIMPNGIDTQTFNPENFSQEQKALLRESLGIDSDDFVGVFVGRLGEEKSVDKLINGWGKILGNKKNHKLLIIGDGPLAESLRQQAASLTSSIIFTGKVSHKEISLYFAISNYFTTASLTEMMSISMLEAMSMALPCIVLYDEKNQQQIMEGKTGFIRKSVPAMCEVILELQKLPQNEYKVLCDNVRLNTLTLDCDTTTDKILQLYNQAIKRHTQTKGPKKLP